MISDISGEIFNSDSDAIETRNESVGEVQLVDIYTDGACSGNPGSGGWGALLLCRGQRKELCGGEPDTTNNRMEITAAIMALEALKKPCKVRLHTDSQYLRKGITQWIKSWQANAWRTSSREPVKNVDLWQRLQKALECHQVEWLWVRGHSGNIGNERADALAREGLAKLPPPKQSSS